MKLSATGLEHIKGVEGGFRDKAYWDRKRYSIGYGHSAPWIKKHDRVTKKQAEQYLAEDVAVAEAAINRSVTVPLSQHQFDALVSWSFNVGITAARNSTLIKKLNTGDYTSVPSQLMRWLKPKTLRSRRKAEIELWNRGTQMGFELTKTDRTRLAQAHPDLRKFVERAATISPHRFRVNETKRSIATQRANIKRGVSWTMNSRHLNGCAVDIFPYDDAGKLQPGAWPLYYRLAPHMKQAAKEAGVKINWGGDWRRNKDGPHWELNWKAYPSRAANFKEGDVPQAVEMAPPEDQPQTEAGRLKKSRILRAGVSGPPGGVLTYENAPKLVAELQEAEPHFSAGTIIGTVLGVSLLCVAVWGLYARWDDAGRPGLRDIFA